MSNGTNQMGALMLIANIVIIIGAGAATWNWVEPNSFAGGIGFLILWAVIGTVARYILMAILMMLFDK